MAGEGLTVKPWRKGGQGPVLRLYVKTKGGQEVGWRELATGREHLDRPGMWPQFNAACESWIRAQGRASSAAVSRDAAAADVTRPGRGRPVRPGVGGLAGHRAGESTDAVADRMRIGNPVLRGLGRLLGVRTADQAWRAGAVGERVVGRSLDRWARRRGRYVLHNVPLGGGGDVDHLVIGPHGVACLNTKHHRGADVRVTRSGVKVGKWDKDYLDRSTRETMRVRAALDRAGFRVHVTSVIVFHGYRTLRGRHSVRGVRVLSSAWVWLWLRLPARRVLTEDEARILYETASQEATWRLA